MSQPQVIGSAGTAHTAVVGVRAGIAPVVVGLPSARSGRSVGRSA
jgi:phosphohistidine swiveling domain-containing protein